jgi:putative FmdB family regulatory protein
MPIYEFECEDCGKRSEVKQWDVPDYELQCECGGTAQRIISSFSFTFTQPNKGSRVMPGARPVRR